MIKALLWIALGIIIGYLLFIPRFAVAKDDVPEPTHIICVTHGWTGGSECITTK